MERVSVRLGLLRGFKDVRGLQLRPWGRGSTLGPVKQEVTSFFGGWRGGEGSVRACLAYGLRSPLAREEYVL